MYKIYTIVYTILWITKFLQCMHSPTDTTIKQTGFLTVTFLFVWVAAFLIKQFKRWTPCFILMLYIIATTLHALSRWDTITTTDQVQKIFYLLFNLLLVSMFLSPSIGITLCYLLVHYAAVFLIVLQVGDFRDPEVLSVLVYTPMQGILTVGLFVILQKRELKRFA